LLSGNPLPDGVIRFFFPQIELAGTANCGALAAGDGSSAGKQAVVLGYCSGRQK